jgi:L-arabinose transport system ATP-binding protein
LISLEGIGKSFPEVVALEGVSLAVAPGEIRALMGENGAGKSTLLKILAGDYQPDTGRVVVNDEERVFDGPRASADAGIAIIHQELQLVAEMTVADNLLLGVFPTRGLLLNGREILARASAILDRMGGDIDPKAKVKELPIGLRQMVEIGKALLRDARIIAFDEPTSSLSARETETLMRIIRDLKAEGHAIIYVSHRMEEVFELCDSITILRDGQLVATHADLSEVSQDQVVTEMAGRRIEDVYGFRSRPLGDTRVAVRGLLGEGLSAPISFEARRGELLGFFGLVGAGRTELFKLMFGARLMAAGAIDLNNITISLRTPRSAIAAGLALAPEDRKDEGIIPLASVSDNINLAARNIAGKSKSFLDGRQEHSRAKALIKSLRIKTSSAEAPIRTLSGGNQQKTILARWLAADSDVFLLDEPTRGIDVGSRSEIYALLYELAEQGKTLLVASSDMPELLGVCDRIIVMREGAISGAVMRAEASPEGLLRMALPDASSVQ